MEPLAGVGLEEVDSLKAALGPRDLGVGPKEVEVQRAVPVDPSDPTHPLVSSYVGPSY